MADDDPTIDDEQALYDERAQAEDALHLDPHQQRLIVDALGDLIAATGITRPVPLTGPMLLNLAAEASDYLATLAAAAEDGHLSAGAAMVLRWRDKHRPTGDWTLTASAWADLVRMAAAVPTTTPPEPTSQVVIEHAVLPNGTTLCGATDGEQVTNWNENNCRDCLAVVAGLHRIEQDRIDGERGPRRG